MGSSKEHGLKIIKSIFKIGIKKFFTHEKHVHGFEIEEKKIINYLRIN